MTETFWTLLHDAAHWEFEIFLMLVFDGLVGAMLWPFIKKHWDHHVARDKREKTIAGPPLVPGLPYAAFVDGKLVTIFVNGIADTRPVSKKQPD